MAFQFPASPAVGQVFTPIPGVNYKWNGTGWAPLGGADLFVFKAGDTMTGPLTAPNLFAGGGVAAMAGNAAISPTFWPLFVGAGAGQPSGMALAYVAADAFGGSINIYKGRGTPAAPVLVNLGDNLGSLVWRGMTGAGTASQGARIDAIIDAAPGVGDLPTRLTFYTTPDGGGSPVERMRIAANGTVKIPNLGGVDPALTLVAGAGATALDLYGRAADDIGGLRWLTAGLALKAQVYIDPGNAFIFQTGVVPAQQFGILNVPGTVNWPVVYGNVAGQAVVLTVQGADTNIDLLLAAKGTGVVRANGPFAAAGTISSAQGTFTNLNATNNLGISNAAVISGALTVGGLTTAQQVNTTTTLAAGGTTVAYPAADSTLIFNQGIVSSGGTGSGSQWPPAVYHYLRHFNGAFSPQPIYRFTPINITVSLGWHDFGQFYTNHPAETSVMLRIMGCNGTNFVGLGCGIYPIYNNADYGGKIDWEYAAASPATTALRLSCAINGSVNQNGNLVIANNANATGNAQAAFSMPAATQATNAEWCSAFIHGSAGAASFGLVTNSSGNHILTSGSNLYFALQGGTGAFGTWLGAIQNNSYWICAGYQTTPCDRDLKPNIRPIANALRDLLAIPGIRFYNKFLGHDDLGLTAQDVEAVFPELVSHPVPAGSDKPVMALNYQGLIAPMIEAIRELNARLTAMEARA